jgi:hypothetical protein
MLLFCLDMVSSFLSAKAQMRHALTCKHIMEMRFWRTLGYTKLAFRPRMSFVSLQDALDCVTMGYLPPGFGFGTFFGCQWRSHATSMLTATIIMPKPPILMVDLTLPDCHDLTLPDEPAAIVDLTLPDERGHGPQARARRYIDLR